MVTAPVVPLFVKAVSDERFQRVMLRQERDFRRIQIKLFKEQIADMLKRLRRITGQKADPLDFNLSDIFTAAAWGARFRELGKPSMARAMEAGAESQITLFRLDIVFDLTKPIPSAWLDKRAQFWSARVNGETSRLVNRAMVEVNNNREGVAGFARRLREIDAFNSDVRAFRAARTETVAATNQGHLESYREAEIPGKEWRTSRDARVRPLQEGDDPRWNHVAADGQVVGLDEPFIVSGESLSAPGQDGSPGNVINCRCNVLPVFTI